LVARNRSSTRNNDLALDVAQVIGRVRTDTDHFSAKLNTSVRELEATDWLPFRQVRR